MFEREREREFSRWVLAAMTGFDHSAFTFSYEAYLVQAQISPTEVPPGALVTFLQKGLQFLEIEANLNEVRRKEFGDARESANLELFLSLSLHIYI